MANEIDPQQIDALNDNLAKLIDALGGDSKNKTPQVKNWDDLNKAVKKSVTDYDSLRGALGATSKALGSLADGAKGASQYNSAVDSGGKAVSQFAGVLGSLVGGPLGAFVKGIGLAAEGVSKYVQAVNKQADALFKSYQDLSRFGGTDITGGMQQVYSQMQKFGYGIKELGNLSQLIQENSQALALMGGTVVDGTNQFAELSRNIRESQFGIRLQQMGKTVDDLNKGEANYIKLQMALGQAQTEQQDKLQQGAENYLVQQDRLAKLTGVSADRQQQINEEAASEERFGAYIRQLKAKAAEAEARGDTELAEKLRNKAAEDFAVNEQLLTQGGRNVAKGFRDLRTGAIAGSKEAAQLFRGMPQFANAVVNGAGEVELMTTAIKDSKKNLQTFDPNRIYGIGDAAFGLGSEMANLSNLNEDYAATQERVRRQQGANGETVEKTTDNMVKMGIAQRATRDKMQDLLQLGIEPVTAAMAALADLIDSIVHPFGGSSYSKQKSTSGATSTMPGGTSGKVSAPPSPASSTYKNNANYLLENLQKDYGLTRSQAAGIVANFAHESAGLQPGINEMNPLVPGSKGGFGIAQWTGPRRIALENFARERGLNVADLSTQYAFLKHEFATNKQYANILSQVKQTGTAAEATQAFLPFETGGDPRAIVNMKSRLYHANQIENMAPVATASSPIKLSGPAGLTGVDAEEKSGWGSRAMYGALAGGTVGSVLPGFGTASGAVLGALSGILFGSNEAQAGPLQSYKPVTGPDSASMITTPKGATTTPEPTVAAHETRSMDAAKSLQQTADRLDDLVRIASQQLNATQQILKKTA